MAEKHWEDWLKNRAVMSEGSREQRSTGGCSVGQKQALVKAEFKKTTQGRHKSHTNAAVVPEKVLNNLSDNCEGAGYKSCCVLMSRCAGWV